jgi:hypothetical protein
MGIHKLERLLAVERPEIWHWNVLYIKIELGY